MIHEYPLGGQPPMMTHIFSNQQGERIIAAKGAPEAILKVCALSKYDASLMQQAVLSLAHEGYRVLGVAEAVFTGYDFPSMQQDFPFELKGLIAFYDPPKANIGRVLKQFYRAGIQVKMVTGDNAETSATIAKEIGLKDFSQAMSGDELMHIQDTDLYQRVKETAVFTRMYPEAKLRIINALKDGGEIVAMTGDGVNDGPALKAAHIGIAMGQRGSGIAKEAASLILMEDNLEQMVDAVAIGRKIYSNLKKAIQYIISIHIPIILTVLIPLVANWIYPNIFSPVHIIFLELIMGPTCSIIYENEPIEKNSMLQAPRPFSTTFFNWHELATSIVQGLMITAGTLGVYQYAAYLHLDESSTRTMVFVTLITSNIVLTLVNRSFYYSVFTTLKYRNRLVPLIIVITLLLTALLVYVEPFMKFFGFIRLTNSSLGFSVMAGTLAVAWFEIVKWQKRIQH